jgi:hypothetical protein
MTRIEEIREHLRIIKKKGMKNRFYKGDDVEILLEEIDRLIEEVRRLRVELTAATCNRLPF